MSAKGRRGFLYLVFALGALLSGDVLHSQPAATDLDRARTVPSVFRASLGHDRITFRGLTKNSVIKIYSLSGALVVTLIKSDDATEDYVWRPLVNSAGLPLSSGVYLYHIEGDGGHKAKGKFMVIK